MAVEMKGKPARWARSLADLLTLSRLVGGVLLALAPWEAATDSLRRLVRWSVLLWSTDAVDGRIARRSRLPASWLGQREILVDSALALGVGVALARSGCVSGTLLAAWLAVCLAAYAIRPAETALLVFMLPLQLALPILTLVHGLPEFHLYLVWAAAVAVLNRARLKWVIETFIDGLPRGLREWIGSWLPAWLRLSPQERASFQAAEPED